MKASYVDLANRAAIPPLQFLVELALMNQPWDENWPTAEEDLVETIRARRLIRQGYQPSAMAPSSTATPPPIGLPVSVTAAAILAKLHGKNYGQRPVRVFTLMRKWVHGATEDDIEELVRRGSLEWVDNLRDCVRLNSQRASDTEQIVQIFRRSGPRAS